MNRIYTVYLCPTCKDPKWYIGDAITCCKTEVIPMMYECSGCDTLYDTREQAENCQCDKEVA